MRCEHARPSLGAYSDGELGDDLRRSLEDHLAGCEMCRKELASLQALGNLLGGLPEPAVPEGLESSILQEALRLHPEVHRTSRIWSGILRAAAALLVALAGAYLGIRSSGRPTAPTAIVQAPGDGSVESLYEQSFSLLPADSSGALVLSLYQEEGR